MNYKKWKKEKLNKIQKHGGLDYDIRENGINFYGDGWLNLFTCFIRLTIVVCQGLSIWWGYCRFMPFLPNIWIRSKYRQPWQN